MTDKSINASERPVTVITNPVPHSFERDEPIIVYGHGAYHAPVANNGYESGVNSQDAIETQVGL